MEVVAYHNVRMRKGMKSPPSLGATRGRKVGEVSEEQALAANQGRWARRNEKSTGHGRGSVDWWLSDA